MVLHEGLPVKPCMIDPQLQSSLGGTVELSTLNITDYLEQFLFNPPPENPEQRQ